MYTSDRIFPFIASVPWNLGYRTSSFAGNLTSEGIIKTNLFLWKELENLRTKDLKGY